MALTFMRKSIMAILLLIASVFTTKSFATDIGIAIAVAPEQSFSVCIGDNAVNTLNCAKEKCASGDVFAASDCLRVRWCYPMGWTADIFTQSSEIHWHDYTCGWSSRAALERAVAIKCDDDILIECIAVQIWSPDGKRVGD